MQSNFDKTIPDKEYQLNLLQGRPQGQRSNSREKERNLSADPLPEQAYSTTGRITKTKMNSQSQKNSNLLRETIDASDKRLSGSKEKRPGFQVAGGASPRNISNPSYVRTSTANSGDKRKISPQPDFKKLPKVSQSSSTKMLAVTYSCIMFKALDEAGRDSLKGDGDDRFRYLTKYGTIKRLEGNNSIIFAELPQIPSVWVFYRKVSEREQNLEKLHLDNRDLNHVPLLEGEEKLKLLTFKGNRLQTIENLVSLPNLIYLDLYDNQIKELENLHTIPTLRVLMVGKNKISRIKNLDALVKLDVLDLNKNFIASIEGLRKLEDLRILNLSNNLISKIEFLDGLVKLTELNLSANKIQKIENLSQLKSLEKLFLAQNKISDLKSVSYLRGLNKLVSLTLEENPISADKVVYQKTICATLPRLETLDYEQVSAIDSDQDVEKNLTNGKSTKQANLEKKQMDASTEENSYSSGVQKNKSKANGRSENKVPSENSASLLPEDVISIISEQFRNEVDRIQRMSKLGITNRKDLQKESLLEGGHAEIENGNTLYLYGNSFEIVLSQENFQNTVEIINFEYCIFEYIAQSKYLQMLKKFRKLKKMTLKNANVCTFLQLARLEIVNFESLVLKKNPINSCKLLRDFVVYRFPQLKDFNGESLNETDKTEAKYKFHMFDKILLVPNKILGPDKPNPKDKSTTQALTEKAALALFQDTVNETTEGLKIKSVFEEAWNTHVYSLIHNYLVGSFGNQVEE